MTVVLVTVIVVLLVLLGAGFIVAARGSALGRFGRRPPLPPSEPAARPEGAQRARGPAAEAQASPADEARPAAPQSEERVGSDLDSERVAELEAELLAASQAEALIEAAATAAAEVEPAEEEPEVGPPPSFRDRLARTRQALASSFGGLRGRRKLDERTIEDLEEALILADVGLPTTTRLLDDLRDRLRAGEAGEGSDLAGELKAVVTAVFDDEDLSLRLEPGSTNVWLFVGVNGAGKTTTIGKLAAREVAAGRRVVLGAGDTFRAAAGDQLELWATRAGASIVRGAEGADPSSVIFDAVQHAAARDAELVLADSAGRLHTKVNLMEELRKVRRVADRPPGKVTEVLLVLDATTGQNGLVQARQFAEAVGVTGVVLTKLDGTAKGGVAIAIRSELGLPIKLVGLGEGVQDLVEFDPVEFADALFG